MGFKTPQSSRPLPAPPPGFNPDKFFRGPLWFQKWEIFPGVFTPGINDVSRLLDDMRFPSRLDGKRVLDIGAWNGCVSLECERRGAAEVIALSPEPARQTGFKRMSEAIGSRRVRYLRGSAYDLNPKALGKFDIVLFCGVLYHLRYPLLAVDNIRRVCRGETYIESYVWNSDLADRSSSLPLWIFFRFHELAGDSSNWFGPTAAGVMDAFSSAGFRVEQLSLRRQRATFRARPSNAPPVLDAWWKS